MALVQATRCLEAHDQQAVELTHYRADDTALDHAITTWRSWAAGNTITDADHDHANEQLARHVETVPEARTLLTTLAPEHPALRPPARHLIEPTSTTASNSDSRGLW